MIQADDDAAAATLTGSQRSLSSLTNAATAEYEDVFLAPRDDEFEQATPLIRAIRGRFRVAVASELLAILFLFAATLTTSYFRHKTCHATIVADDDA